MRCEKGESVGHLISGCKMLTQRERKREHDNVARTVHKTLCGKYGLERAAPWYDHALKGVVESDEINVIRDFKILCDHHIEGRKPYIVVVEKEEKKWLIVDIATLNEKMLEASAGYELKERNHKINHLLFMDYLKLYRKSRDQIDSLVRTVHLFSTDIRMEFGIKKCAVQIHKGGKAVKCYGIILPDGQVLKQMDEDVYKYLGILTCNQVMDRERKAIFRKEYIRRLKLVLKSKLNRRNKILAINTWAVSLLRYSGGIIRWNKDDLLEMDRRTRKLMTMNGALHLKSDINRIYIPTKRGGRGLIIAESSVQRGKNSMDWYIKHRVEPFLGCVKPGNIIETEIYSECCKLAQGEDKGRHDNVL